MERKFVVIFERRDDGGLRAYSDEVPGFVLSHSDPSAVLKDVKPALEVILSHLFKGPVVVEEISPHTEALPTTRVYLTRAA